MRVAQGEPEMQKNNSISHKSSLASQRSNRSRRRHHSTLSSLSYNMATPDPRFSIGSIYDAKAGRKTRSLCDEPQRFSTLIRTSNGVGTTQYWNPVLDKASTEKTSKFTDEFGNSRLCTPPSLVPKPHKHLVSYLEGTSPLYKFLRFWAFLPNFYSVHDPEVRNHSCLYILYLTYSILCSCFSLSVFCFQVYLIHMTMANMGFLHVDTLTMILTGLKPLQTGISLILFMIKTSSHNEFLKRISIVDKLFSSHFHVVPSWRFGVWTIILLTILAGAIPLTLRAVQFSLGQEVVGENWLSDVSVALVALLTIWQFLPLLYFLYVARLIRFYFNQLEQQIWKDQKLARKPLTFYYDVFLEVTNASEALGNFFNPYIFFSLAMSIVVLCLTIYFGINATVILQVTPDMSPVHRYIIYFLPVWAGLQISAALIHLLGISLAAINSNEAGSQILNTVLLLTPRDEQSRFTMACFIGKIQTQFMWGIGVWRAFLLQRYSLFTIFSAIVTYAIVLIKLQNSSVKKCVAQLQFYSNQFLGALLDSPEDVIPPIAGYDTSYDFDETLEN